MPLILPTYPLSRYFHPFSHLLLHPSTAGLVQGTHFAAVIAAAVRLTPDQQKPPPLHRMMVGPPAREGLCVVLLMPSTTSIDPVAFRRMGSPDPEVAAGQGRQTIPRYCATPAAAIVELVHTYSRIGSRSSSHYLCTPVAGSR